MLGPVGRVGSPEPLTEPLINYVVMQQLSSADIRVCHVGAMTYMRHNLSSAGSLKVLHLNIKQVVRISGGIKYTPECRWIQV